MVRLQKQRTTIALIWMWRAMRLYHFAWVLWIVGTTLILLSWMRAVSPEIGWAGFAISGVGAVITWLPYRMETRHEQWKWHTVDAGAVSSGVGALETSRVRAQC
jgi:hypothetical protein